MEPTQLPRLVSAIDYFLDRGYLGFKARVDAGVPTQVQLWAEGFGDRLVRARIWLESNADRIVPGAVL